MILSRVLCLLIMGLLSLSLMGGQDRVMLPPGMPEYYKAFQSYLVEENTTRVVLRNGLTVLVEEHPLSDLAVVTTSVRVGEFDDPVASKVVADLLANRLSRAVADSGATLELEVGRYETHFISSLPGQKASEIVEEHLRLLEWEEEEFQPTAEWVERQVRSRTERADPVRAPSLTAVFGNTALAEAGNDRGTRADRFHADYFHPGNLVLSVTGSVRRESVLRTVAELGPAYAPVEEGKQGRHGREGLKIELSDLHYSQTRGLVEEPRITIGAGFPTFAEEDFWGAQLLRYVLSEGTGSLLALPRGEEEEREPPLIFDFELQETRHGNLMLLHLFPNNDSWEGTELRALALLQVLGESPLPASLLERAKALLLLDHFRKMELLPVRSRLLARFELLGDFRDRDRLPARILDMDPGDLQRIAGKYLSLERLSLVEHLPADAEQRSFDSRSFRETVEILLPGYRRTELGLLEIFGELEAQPFRLPEFSPSYAEEDLRRSSILRGPEIYLREQHALPLVHVGIFFAGGRAGEEPEQAGLTRLLLQTVLESRRRTGIELVRMEASGIRIEQVSEDDFFGFRMIAFTPAMGNALREITSWFRSSFNLNDEMVDTALNRLKLRRFQGAACPVERETGRRLRQGLYPNHPYGYASLPECREIRSLSLAEVNRWIDRFVRLRHPYLIVTGDVSGTSFLQGLVAELSDPDYQTGQTVPREVSEPAERVVSVREGNLLLAGVRGPSIGRDEIEMLDIAESLLGGRHGRLFQLLRVEESLVWSADFRGEAMAQGGIRYVEIRAGEEHLGEASSRAISEVRRLAEANLPEPEYLSALVLTLTRFLERQQNPELYLTDTMNMVLGGEPADYARRYRLNVRQIRPGEVESAVRRYFGVPQQAGNR